ncbi:MAG: hypothetical protein U0324_16725 [Polyangiales bacterium]
MPPIVTPLTLALLAQQHRCACSDATRVVVGPYEIPVGPATVLLAAVVALFGPAALVGLVKRRREARAMRDVLSS